MRIIENADQIIQEMLDRRGLVSITDQGCYIISKTLVIHSHTRLILAPGVTMKAAPLSRCALIENESFYGGGDADIAIEDGVWDGNCDEMGMDPFEETSVENRTHGKYDPHVFKGKMMRFAHIEHFSLEKMTVRNPVSYGIQVADARFFIIRDILFDYNCNFGTTDGVHINGPARFGLIENLSGVTNDDTVSLTSVDEAHAQVTRGPIDSVEIRNIAAENGYSGVRLLSRGEPVTNIRISGVYGTYRHNAVLVSQHNLNAEPVWFDQITIEHIHASKSSVPLHAPRFIRWEKNAVEKLPVVWFEQGIVMGSVIIRDISRHEKAQTAGALLQLDKGGKIHRLTVENICQTCAPGVCAPLFINEAEVDILRFNE